MLAMYHDQACSAKIRRLWASCEYYLGLPLVRISVDHGTALDLAGRGTADPNSRASRYRLHSGLLPSVPAPWPLHESTSKEHC